MDMVTISRWLTAHYVGLTLGGSVPTGRITTATEGPPDNWLSPSGLLIGGTSGAMKVTSAMVYVPVSRGMFYVTNNAMSLKSRKISGWWGVKDTTLVYL